MLDKIIEKFSPPIQVGLAFAILAFMMLCSLIDSAGARARIEIRCRKSSKKREYIPYFKKNFWAKVFLIRTRSVLELGTILLDWIDKILIITYITLIIPYCFIQSIYISAVLEIIWRLHMLTTFLSGLYARLTKGDR